MKRRKVNKSGERKRRQDSAKAEQERQRNARYEYGPADPMPDGSKRKAGEDVIGYLVQTGKLTPIQEAAAREIELVFMLRTQGLWAKTQELERIDQAFESGDLSKYMDMERRYDAFAAWSAENRIRTKRNYHALILDACIHGDGVRDFERRNGIKNGTGYVWIMRGLNQYAVCANWITTAA